jgi:hypothetical protein
LDVLFEGFQVADFFDVVINLCRCNLSGSAEFKKLSLLKCGVFRGKTLEYSTEEVDVVVSWFY